MKKTALFFLILLLIFTVGKAQPKSSLRIIANPFIQKIGNPDNTNISVEHPLVHVDYSKKPGIELGLAYQRNIKDHWSFGIGATWRIINHDIFYEVGYIKPSTNTYTVFNSREQFINQQFANLNLYTQYRFGNRHAFNFIVNAYVLTSQKSNFPEQYYMNGYATSTYDYSFYQQIYLWENTKPHIVPEVNFQTKLFKNLYLTLGSKLKWRSSRSIYAAHVQGYLEKGGSMDDVLHQSGITTKDLSWYLGFVYEIPFGKSN